MSNFDSPSNKEQTHSTSNTVWQKLRILAWLFSTGRVFYASPMDIALDLGLGTEIYDSISPFESPKNAIFREIVDGRRDVLPVLKGRTSIVIRDKRPIAEVHLLVLPKMPLNSVLSLRANTEDVLMRKCSFFSDCLDI
jgi:hypothetical protein